MRAVLGILLVACASDKPPPLDDPAHIIKYDASFDGPEAVPVDSGPPQTGDETHRDYEGVCPTDRVLVWRWHDFQTTTPSGSKIELSVRTADAQTGLGTAKSIPLVTISGPDITSWAGGDVGPKLTEGGEKSRHFLRVTTKLVKGSGAAPAVLASRQQYDCTAGL